MVVAEGGSTPRDGDQFLPMFSDVASSCLRFYLRLSLVGGRARSAVVAQALIARASLLTSNGILQFRLRRADFAFTTPPRVYGRPENRERGSVQAV